MEIKAYENKLFNQLDQSGKTFSNKEFYKCKFEKSNFSECSFNRVDFSNCTFNDCDFTQADLTNIDFTDSHFINCNFTLTKMRGTGLKVINFDNCKIMGIDFSITNDFMFAVKFNESYLDYSTFFGKKMKNTLFSDCSVKEVDFTRVDLTGSIFKNCDLTSAIFLQSTIEKVDFTTAKNYSIDPEQNKIKNAKFSISDLPGLLTKYNIKVHHS